MHRNIVKEVKGIECNECLANIEKEVNQLNGVSATIDYEHKTLTLTIEKAKDLGKIIDRVKDIAGLHQHQIIVKEKRFENKVIKTFTVENLDCANCADKIEHQVAKLDGVVAATCDFVSKKLVLEIAEASRAEEIIASAHAAVRKAEPEASLVEREEKTEEEKEGRRKLLWDFLTLGIGGVLFTLSLVLELPTWQELVIFVLSYLFVGGKVLLRAVRNILRGRIFDENLLMTIATIGAFLIRDFAEGAAVMLFYQVGELLQDIAVDRSRKSISKLMDIRPEYANLKSEAEIRKVSPAEVKVGDLIVVKPGEKIPLDGKVIEGNSFVDTTALTGESVLRKVEEGSEVLSGFINKNGLLTIEVTKNFGDSAVSVILDLVENASSKKAATENFITKFARYYTPVVVLLAAMIAFLPLLLFDGATLAEWGTRALVFLVISCPCALVISIPLGFFGGIGGASKRGILIKGSNYLEALVNVETVVFDKTGTLTKGVFNVTQINPQEGHTEEEVLMYAAHAEAFSNHPIAQSILSHFGREIDKSRVENYEEISGMGVKIRLDGKEILAGNSKLMNSNQIAFPKKDAIGTVVHVALNHEYIGNIIISDEIKTDSFKAINELKALGVKNTVMLTGDSKKAGEEIAKTLGIDRVFSELLPNEKVEKFELLEAEKSPAGKIIFVGDGINDAPVLARADVGIAMGGLGSDAALEAADVVIMTDEPSKIATSIRIARRTKKIVWENIIFSLAVKFIFLVLGAAGFASMWAAVFADVGVSLIAILNALRVLKTQKK